MPGVSWEHLEAVTRTGRAGGDSSSQTVEIEAPDRQLNMCAGHLGPGQARCSMLGGSLWGQVTLCRTLSLS